MVRLEQLTPGASVRGLVARKTAKVVQVEWFGHQAVKVTFEDDPGGGRLSWAELLIKELAIRSDLERCLVVAPGNLVEQLMLRLGQPLALAGAPHSASL